MATKKKILKQLKAIAREMPTIQERKGWQGEKVAGAQLLKEGVETKSDGAKIEAKEFYRRKQQVVGLVDHIDKMKKLYKRFGEEGVRQYLVAVKTFELNNQPKKEEPCQQAEK